MDDERFDYVAMTFGNVITRRRAATGLAVGLLGLGSPAGRVAAKAKDGSKLGKGGPKPGKGGPKPGNGGPKPGKGKCPAGEVMCYTGCVPACRSSEEIHFYTCQCMPLGGCPAEPGIGFCGH